ncbi:putative protein NPG1 [Helianthus debilis subsp. tardiflorus]
MQTLQVFFYLLIAEAAESCKVTLDIIESSLPDGLPENLDDQNPNCGLPLLLASKIHVENPNSSEGVMTAKRAIQVLKDKSDDRVGVGYYYLGVSLSACSRWEVTECKRVDRQHEALECLETAGRLTRMVDSRVLYDLSLETLSKCSWMLLLVMRSVCFIWKVGLTLKGGCYWLEYCRHKSGLEMVKVLSMRL